MSRGLIGQYVVIGGPIDIASPQRGLHVVQEFLTTTSEVLCCLCG